MNKLFALALLVSAVCLTGCEKKTTPAPKANEAPKMTAPDAGGATPPAEPKKE